MPGFVVRRTALLHLAIDSGIEPTATGLAEACGLSVATMARVLNGEHLSASTIATIVGRFRLDGRGQEFFERVGDGDANGDDGA